MSNSISKKIAYFLIIFSFVLFGISGYLTYKKNLENVGVKISADDLSITERPSTYFSDDNNYGNTNTDEYIREKTSQESIVKRKTNKVLDKNDTNEKLRDRIEKKYNITVNYGEEAAGYSVGGMSVVPISSYTDNTIALNNLEMALEKYPDNFFNELHEVYPLTIYLIDTYSVHNVTGVSDSTNLNHVTISIATAYSFDDSINHELFHYIEHYLNYKNGYFTTWENLNPNTFVYNNVDVSLSYSRNLSSDSYFVNDYAQVSPTEDRASTFEYMMSSNKPSCLNEGKPIYLKAKYMSDLMDAFIDSVTSENTEYWERFL